MIFADRRRGLEVLDSLRELKAQKLLWFGAAVLACHALQEIFVGPSALGSFLANILQISCGLVAATSCFVAIRRATGSTRLFWLLIGLSCLTWSFADSGWMYYESYLRVSPERNSIFHFLVDCRALFLALALFIDPDGDDRPFYLDSAFILDTVQLLIIFSLIYLGWYQVASLQHGQELSMLRSDQIELGANFALIAMAVWQYRRSRTTGLGRLYLGFLICFGTLVVGITLTDITELRTLREVPTGTWLDLWWSIPFLMVAVWAGCWKQEPGFYSEFQRERSLYGLIIENTVYAGAPLVVLIQVTALGPEWRRLSFWLLGFSILCFGARLALSKFHEAEAEKRVRRAHRALVESEARFRTLIEDAPLAVGIRRDSKIVWVNRVFVQLFGYDDAAEMMAQPIGNLFAPEFRVEVEQKAKQRSQGRPVPATYETVALRKDGSQFDVQVDAVLVGLPDGPASIAFISDISERKRAEAALRKGEERMRLFIEHAPAAAAVFDREMRYVQASRKWRDDYGLGDKEILGISHYELFPELPANWREAHQRGLAGEILRAEKDRFEHADGTFQWIRWEIHPWYEREAIGGIAIFAEDITQVEQRAAALRDSEARYRTLFERSVAGVGITSLDGTLIDCNDAWARMLGFQHAEECRGRQLGEHYSDATEREKLVAQLLQTGIFLNRERELRRIDGTPVWVSLNMVVVSQGDRPPLIQSTMIDITQRKRAEQVLMYSEKLERERANELQTILDTLPMPLMISHDTQCQRVTMNRAASEHLGMAPGTNSLLDGWSDNNGGLRFMQGEVELSKEQLPMAKAAATGEVIKNAALRIIIPDGTEKYEICSAAPLLDDSGRLRGSVLAAIDITDQVRAEEALRHSEERFRVALKASPITVFNQDADLRYTWIYNPQLYWQRDVIGKTDDEIIGTRKAQALSELKRRVLRTKAPARGEVAVPINSHSHFFEVTVEPLWDAKGNLVGITGVYMDIAKLRELADRLQESRDQLALEKSYLKTEIQSEMGFEEIIGQSPSLREVLRKSRIVAPTDSNVLLLGETGTGKEVVARSIHELSVRREKTFVKLNCAAVPSGLLESELFGHERGAFTGAVSQKIGRMELADKGTLFLDEIGELPLELQPKLLRVLQDREFERLGGIKTIKVDVRIIAATNRDLRHDIADKKFREDLFYRLNVFPIELPPLRDRRVDIPALVHHFVEKHALKMGKQISGVPDEVMSILCKWNWPGNVRELENMIERMVILTKGEVLVPPPAEIQQETAGIPEDDLAEMERDHILRVLRDTNGVLSGADGAANRLGLKRTTLQSMMKRLGIEPREYRGLGNGASLRH